MTVTLGDFSAKQSFLVLDHLSTPVILGCDYLTTNGFILNFQQGTFYRAENPTQMLQLLPAESTSCHLIAMDDDCPQAIPTTCKSHSSTTADMPSEVHPSLTPVLQEFKELFSQQLGKTNVAEHTIDTGDALPIRIPPRQIPFHYVDKVNAQLEDMVKEGIIRPSTSPWCAPAVYVPKSSGEIRICVDFVQLNKVTKKDSYPVPRSEGPQQKLAGKKIFSKLDLKSAYWQFPMEAHSIEKTAFCPGPGYGLWEFTVMPYGLTCATQTCQRGLDTILQNCKHCVDNYVDDCIVFSDDMTSHIQDLRLVLGKLQAAGFTLRGSKCSFGTDTITHLGFKYTSSGVAPSPDKTKAISDWPTPRTIKDVRSFVGLLNFYRRFIPHFAKIAGPLNALTSSGTAFTWEPKHAEAFSKLKEALVSPPLLDYPLKTDQFVLSTDASDSGLGAVLSTARGTVIEYASRTLSNAEKKYATTEKECLAIVWAVHKFRHYLIGAHFLLETDHKPLEWLNTSKSSKSRSQRLERWSLELRAFQFTINHRPGSTNQPADALSRHPVSVVGVSSTWDKANIAKIQNSDPVLSKVIRQLETHQIPKRITPWLKFPYRRYLQLWPQLILHESVLYRKVKYPSMSQEKLLLVVPTSLRRQFLRTAHDKAGHQGTDRTMARLSEIAYWVGIAKDVGYYCNHCTTCQITKAPASQPAPLQPIVASQPWEMVAVDILKVPMSSRGNQYLLVIQDYFSKWPFAIPLPDQKAERIVQALKDQVFTLVGPPRRLHSDQGRNFESYILLELCKAFGVTKSHTTPYHPMGDGLVERMNRSLLNLLRALVQTESDWEEHVQLLLFVYRTTKHSTTKLSPYEILFGQNPAPLHFPTPPINTVHDPHDYSSQLQRKLLELKELVEANIVEATSKQTEYYKGHEPVKLSVGQQVLLDDPTKGKLDPRWTGPWEVEEFKEPSTVKIRMGTSTRTVHINRTRPLLQGEVDDTPVAKAWSPPNFHHVDGSDSGNSDAHENLGDPSAGSQVVTRSGRVIRPPDYYGH